MIGVLADSFTDNLVVCEFFELFKTPWEFCRSGQHYDVVLSGGAALPAGVSARLFILYGAVRTDADTARSIDVSCEKQAKLSFFGQTLLSFGPVASFSSGIQGATSLQSGKSVAYVDGLPETTFARVGYDLFAEVRGLLVQGQKSEHAGTPTLELHIDLLRRLITGAGIELMEIPPVPEGHPFIACLTHDLDHASMRRHGFDSTIAGFLFRATLGSLKNVFRGRMSLKDLWSNAAAAIKLPLMHLGLAKDIWYEFDRYLEVEKGRPSTFFVIPKENSPGRTATGVAPSHRGTRYDISHIAGKIPTLLAAGCEVGLHGIDAWIDPAKGREELKRISEVSGNSEVGVRMHWLYSDERSAGVLEEAGFTYDSTFGYNNTVGFRAGTVQAFKPLKTESFLELPMHIMDTALFYPSYLDLSKKDASRCVSFLVESAVRFGGALTINWHDRSISPERLWGDFYVWLIEELDRNKAWFATASQAVAWFQMRRSAVFEAIARKDGDLTIAIKFKDSDGLPGLILRRHHRQTPAILDIKGNAGEYTDVAFFRSMSSTFQFEAVTSSYGLN